MSVDERERERVEELLRGHDHAPAPALAARVLARLHEPPPRRFTFARPLLLGATAAGLLLAAGATLGFLARPPPARPLATSPSAPLRTVRLALTAPGAHTVVLVGDFNGWSPDRGVVLTRDGDRFVATLELPPGRYAYGFVVDGRPVESDPDASATEPDGFGGRDSVLEL